MKFGKKIVFPDPDSRVKFEPLKLVYVKPLECILSWAEVNQDPTNMGSDRGKFTKVNLSNKRGALGLWGSVAFFYFWS